MAKTETRIFTVHKPEIYGGRYCQIDFKNLGAALGALNKVGAKNLYLYLVSNQNDYEFELKVANYANWLGDPIYDDAGNKIDSKNATYRKQINEGIDMLLEKGFLVKKYDGVYDFYEESVCNKSLQMEQIVTDVTDCSKKVDEEDILANFNF